MGAHIVQSSDSGIRRGVHTLRQRLRAHAGGLVVTVATVVATIAYASLILQKHAAFGTQVFDLGIFDQGVWLLSRFRVPFVTLRGLNLFADHASYILVLVAPLYWLWSDGRVLLLLTVAALTAGAPLIYLIARTAKIRPLVASSLAVAYLAHPAVGWNVWDVFHPEVLAVPFLLAAYLFAAKRRTGWAAVMLTLTLLVKEDAVLVVVPFALYLGWRFKMWRLAGGMVSLSFAVAVFNLGVVLPSLSPTGTLMYASRYSQYGSSLPQVLAGIAGSPAEVATALFGSGRVWYFVWMLVPLVTALAAPEALAIALPVTLANALSAQGYQLLLRYHYTVYLLAVVAIAAVVGVARLTVRDGPRATPGRHVYRRKHGRRSVRRQGSAALALAILALAWVGNVQAGARVSDVEDPWLGGTSDPAAIREVLTLIPADASVSADWFIAPQLAHRQVVFMYPNPFIRDYWGADGTPYAPVGVDWVVLRTATAVWDPDSDTAQALAMIRADPAFEPVVENATVLMFRRVSS